MKIHHGDLFKNSSPVGCLGSGPRSILPSICAGEQPWGRAGRGRASTSWYCLWILLQPLQARGVCRSPWKVFPSRSRVLHSKTILFVIIHMRSSATRISGAGNGAQHPPKRRAVPPLHYCNKSTFFSLNSSVSLWHGDAQSCFFRHKPKQLQRDDPLCSAICHKAQTTARTANTSPIAPGGQPTHKIFPKVHFCSWRGSRTCFNKYVFLLPLSASFISNKILTAGSPRG